MISEDKASELTGLLLDEHMKVEITFVTDLAKDESVIGRCWNTSIGAVIQYDPAYLTRDLVAHECAHAVTPGCGHNKVWKSQYRRYRIALLLK